MIVKENIEFQRGKDPKESMKIGLDTQMEEKYGKRWKIFKRCNDLSHVSENFQWVSEIQFNEKDPYFNIESYFYYTDEEGAKYNLQYVVILYPYEIYVKEIVNEDEVSIISVNDFVDFTEAFEPDDRGWQGLFESLDFERGKDPKRAMEIGWNQPRHFDTMGEAMEWVADILHLILGKERVPNNILSGKGFINGHYLGKLESFLENRISWDKESPFEIWDEVLFRILHERGFLAESVNFERGKDPKETLDIGIRKFIISKIKNLLEDDWSIEGRSLILDIEFVSDGDGILFSVDDYEEEVDVPYIKDLIKKHGLETYIDILSGETHHQGLGTVTYFFWLTGAGESANIKDQRFWLDGNDSSFQTEKTDGVLFHDKPIRESIDFKRGQNPKKVMGLGEEGLRQKWGSLKKGDVLRIKKQFGVNARNQITSDERLIRMYDPTESLRLNTPAEVYEDGCIGITAYKVAHNYTSHNDYFIWGTPWDFEDLFEKRNGTNEALDFERGKDPKDALEIGSPLARLADELGMTYAEIKQDKKDLHEIVAAAVDPGRNEDEDYRFAFYAVADDPMAYDIPRDSRLFDVALWADDHQDDAIRILRTPDRVSESVNFQRGLDPKQSIGIGVLGRKGISIDRGVVKRGPRRIAPVVDIAQALSNYYKWKKIDRSIFRFPANASPPEYLVTARPGEEMDWPEQGYRKISYEEIVSEIITLAQNDPDFVDWIKPSVISYEWKDWQPLLEAVNFERGIDPKRAMGLGLVKVKGDRGVGDYMVRLIKPYEGDDAAPDEEVWVIEYTNDTELAGARGFAYKYPSSHVLSMRGYWGEIDAFINESINFERGKDPKRAMGIGRSFYNLRPGDILKPKVDVNVGPRTNFIYGAYHQKIWQESYLVVIDSEETPGGKLKIYYYQSWDLAGAQVVRDNIGLYQKENSMTGTERQFKNRFEIYRES